MSEHYVIIEPGGLFWRENGHGYTSDIADAGLFSKDKAERITRGCKGRGDRMERASSFDIRARKRELERLVTQITEMERLVLNIDEPEQQV